MKFTQKEIKTSVFLRHLQPKKDLKAEWKEQTLSTLNCLKTQVFHIIPICRMRLFHYTQQRQCEH